MSLSRRGLWIEGRLVEAASLQGAGQGRRDVCRRHGSAQLPGDDVAREVVEHARQIVPAPASDPQVGEIGLPQLIDGCRRMGEPFGRLRTMKAGLVSSPSAFRSR